MNSNKDIIHLSMSLCVQPCRGNYIVMMKKTAGRWPQKQDTIVHYYENDGT